MTISSQQKPLLIHKAKASTEAGNKTQGLFMESIIAICEELRSGQLWRAMAAEFVGTLMLVVIGCGACVNVSDSDIPAANIVQIAFAFGLIVATVIWCIGHVSGGHVNPAVTIGMLVARRITLARCFFYIVSQSTGAIAGAGILRGLIPWGHNETFGVTTVWDKMAPGQGLGVEIVITFVLVFTVFASIDPKRADLNGSTPLTIGLSVGVCHLFAIKFTGSSMNPARSLGPAVVNNSWVLHWVYWIGPIIGGIIGALLYELIFSEDATLDNIRQFFKSSNYGDGEGYDVNPEDEYNKPKPKGEAEMSV